MTLRRRRRALLISQLYFLLRLGWDKKKIAKLHHWQSTGPDQTLTPRYCGPTKKKGGNRARSRRGWLALLWDDIWTMPRLLAVTPKTTFVLCRDGMMFVYTKLFSTNMDATTFVLHASDRLHDVDTEEGKPEHMQITTWGTSDRGTVHTNNCLKFETWSPFYFHVVIPPPQGPPHPSHRVWGRTCEIRLMF